MAKSKLTQLILDNASLLNIGTSNLSGEKILTAIAVVESDFGKCNRPRYEKSYDIGGTVYNLDKSGLYRGKWLEYGSLMACSYSSFQIMYMVACELGYKSSPIDLSNDEIAISWVIKLINRRILGVQNARLPQEIADAYNSGSCRDRFVPQVYVGKFMVVYADHKRYLQ